MYYIYGWHSALCCINNSNRKIYKILISNKSHVDFCLENIKANKKLNITKIKNLITLTTRLNIDSLVGSDVNHQGIAVLTEPLTQPSLSTLINNNSLQSNTTLVMLDQAHDINNIGASLRACAGFNAIALLISSSNAPKEGGAMAKVASGALESVPLIRVTNFQRTIAHLKQHNFWCAGLSVAATKSISDVRGFNKLCLIFGNEHKGLRSLTAKVCDILVKIPFNDSKLESLNLGTSVAISLFDRFNK